MDILEHTCTTGMIQTDLTDAEHKMHNHVNLKLLYIIYAIVYNTMPPGS